MLEVMKYHLFIFCAVLLIGPCLGDQSTFDCKMKQVAMSYARQLQPWLSDVKLHDALNGAQESKNCNVSVKRSDYIAQKPPNFSVRDGASFYVDAVKGSDSNSGTVNAPFMTISRAVMAGRDSGPGATIVL